MGGQPSPTVYLKMFDYDDQAIMDHISWRSKCTLIVFPQSYWSVFIKDELIVHNSVTQPVKNSLGKLPTMASITDKIGAGQDKIDTDAYFNEGGKDEVT